MISTAGDATLTRRRPEPDATGRLVNGAFALPQPLQGRSKRARQDVQRPDLQRGGRGHVHQQIIATDALRTGAYSKTLTFTLSTTNP